MWTHDDQARELIKDLAEAVSTHTKVSNRTWLVLMTVTILTLLPVAPGGTIQTAATEQPTAKLNSEPCPPEKSSDLLPLPFGLGTVGTPKFYAVVFAMMAILMIGFLAAHAQQLTTLRLAHATVDKLEKARVAIFGIHPRNYFDMLRISAVTRVASLPQMGVRKSRFYEYDGDDQSKHLLARGGYLLLKVFSSLVYFVLPGLALIHAYSRLEVVGIWLILTRAAMLLAAAAWAHTLCADLHYVGKVAFDVWSVARRPSPRTAPPTDGI